MKTLSFLLLPMLTLSPHAAAGGEGRIEGRVFYPVKMARELPNIIVFIIPVGHEVPVQVPAKHALISQKGAKFLPEMLVIPRGQTVDFINNDKIDHNVFSFSTTRRFDLGLYPQGVFKSVKFEKEGPVLILCSIHEWMVGVIYVAPSHLFAVSDKTGVFSITGVPPGRYTAYTWNPKLPTVSEAVEVSQVDVAAAKPTLLMIDLTKDLGGPVPKPGAKKL